MTSQHKNFREVSVRTLLSFLFSLGIGLLRYGTVVFETQHWSFQLVLYGFVYGLFLALWRFRRRHAWTFLLVYFFAESVFLTGALAELRVVMVLIYFGLSAGALIWFEKIFLRSARRPVWREALGLAVPMGLAYTCAATLSLLFFLVVSGIEVEILPNLMGAATIGFLLGLGVGLGHAVADLPRIRDRLS